MSVENKKCEDLSLDNNSTETRKVYINVGGRIHITNSATLAKSKYFSALLKDEKYGMNGKDTPFIDRNGDTFSSVLDCLRNNGKLSEVPTRKLLHELHYFMIDIYNPGNFEEFTERCKKEMRCLHPTTQEIIGKIFKEAIDLIVSSKDVYLHVLCRMNVDSIEIGVGNTKHAFSLRAADLLNRQIIYLLFETFQKECFFETLFYFGWRIASTIDAESFDWHSPFVMVRKN
jgi:hypothetical protein